MTLANKAIFFIIFLSIVLFTMFYGTVHQPAIAIYYLVVTIMVLLWAIDAYSSGELKISRHHLQIPLFAAVIYSFIQIFPFGTVASIAGVEGISRTISLSPFDTQMTALHLLSLALFFSVSLTSVNSASRMNKVVNFLLIFGFAFSFFAILQSFLSPGKIYGIYERFGAFPFGSFVSRHNFAAFVEMTIALPLGLLLSGGVKRDKKLLYVTAIALMGVALLLSGSRGGLVAMIAGLIMMIFVTTRSHGYKKIALRAALAAVFVAVVIAGSIYVGGESSLTRIAETATSKDVTTDRTHIWGVTLQIIKANFPLGAGIGAFGQAYTPFDDYSGLERVEQAHNDYLQVVADGGLVGAAIAGFFLVTLVITIRRNINRENVFRKGVATGAAGGIFAILVHSTFDFVLHTTAISLMFILLLVLLVASGRRYDDDFEESIEPRRNRKKASIMPFSTKSRRV